MILGQLHTPLQKNEAGPYLTTYTKMDHRCTKTMKLLEENIDINLRDRGLGKVFLDMTPKTQMMKEKIDKLNVVKTKNSYTESSTIKKVKRHLKELEKIFANQVPRIYKELIIQ